MACGKFPAFRGKGPEAGILPSDGLKFEDGMRAAGGVFPIALIEILNELLNRGRMGLHFHSASQNVEAEFGGGCTGCGTHLVSTLPAPVGTSSPISSNCET